MASMHQQFRYYGLNTDVQRLRVAAAYLKGSAQNWWNHLEQTHNAPAM